MAEFPAALRAEMDQAVPVLGKSDVTTVFFGGGTPTLLPANELVGILHALRDRFVFAEDVEVTTECNPDSVDRTYLETIRAGGVNRISIGMQSSSSKVLRVLERTHTPHRATEVARLAREVGFDHVSLDLIYGTPGETDDELVASVQEAIAAEPDHLSAYSLIVEPNTRMAAKVNRGEIAPVDEDVLADRYLVIDSMLTAAGYDWYEVSNWARPGGECRHNLGYWRSTPWWGFGPGAHSFLGDERWWNVKHPRAYAEALAQGRPPRAGSERLTAAEREMERVMLELRLREGIVASSLNSAVLDRARTAGLLQDHHDRVVLTVRGRLLADAVIRDLVISQGED